MRPGPLAGLLERGSRRGTRLRVEGLREGAANRVVLVSDALADTGGTDAGADAILERIAKSRREHGITLFGVGVGSDLGDELTEQLADEGDGRRVHVSGEEDAREVFRERLLHGIGPTARDTEAQVAFGPETFAGFRFVGYGNRRVAGEDFRDGRMDVGEAGPGHTVTALYAVRTRSGADGHPAAAAVRRLGPGGRTPHEETGDPETEGPAGSVGSARRGANRPDPPLPID